MVTYISCYLTKKLALQNTYYLMAANYYPSVLNNISIVIIDFIWKWYEHYYTDFKLSVKTNEILNICDNICIKIFWENSYIRKYSNISFMFSAWEGRHSVNIMICMILSLLQQSVTIIFNYTNRRIIKIDYGIKFNK